MIHYTADFDALKSAFENEGISVDAPGFYDDPNFVAIERVQHDLLNSYARFVDTQRYDESYLARAERIIRAATGELYKVLRKDGRKGACIDCSMALSRMLDREGIWNYVVKGAVTINFPKSTRLEPFSFWPVDAENGNPGEFGHKWICAPPFKVVDITIQQQDYDREVAEHVPETILETQGSRAKADVTDICCPLAIMDATLRGVPRQAVIYSYCPHLKDFFSVFPATLVSAGSVTLKYVPCGVGASDGSLDEMTSLKLCGEFAGEIYRKRIAPKLRKI